MQTIFHWSGINWTEVKTDSGQPTANYLLTVVATVKFFIKRFDDAYNCNGYTQENAKTCNCELSDKATKYVLTVYCHS
jgi:hypothetical protein